MSPIRVVDTSDQNTVRRRALRPFHLGLEQAEQDMQTILGHLRTRSPTGPSPPSFAITDESASLRSGATSGSAQAAAPSRFESAWSDPTETASPA